MLTPTKALAVATGIVAAFAPRGGQGRKKRKQRNPIYRRLIANKLARRSRKINRRVGR